MRNLRLLATVLFVAVLLVGIVLLLRQTNVQNDTSVTSAQPTSEQQLATNRVATDPPVKKVRQIVPSAITVGERKVAPMKRANTTANQLNTNRTVLGTTGSAPTSARQQNVLAPGIPPSKANKQKNVGKVDMENVPALKRSKKDVIRNYRKGTLNTNSNNQ